MDIPGNIANKLENLGIQYSLEKYHDDLLAARLQRANSRLTQLARVSFLQSANEKIQLITSASSLCRLDMIIEQINQAVTAVTPEFERRLIDSKKLDVFTALPQASDYRVLVDSGLFEAEKIYLPCGIKGTYLLVSDSDFKKLVSGHEIISPST